MNYNHLFEIPEGVVHYRSQNLADRKNGNCAKVSVLRIYALSNLRITITLTVPSRVIHSVCVELSYLRRIATDVALSKSREIRSDQFPGLG